MRVGTATQASARSWPRQKRVFGLIVPSKTSERLKSPASGRMPPLSAADSHPTSSLSIQGLKLSLSDQSDGAARSTLRLSRPVGDS